MKKFSTAFIVNVLCFLSAFAQTPAIDQLNLAITESNNIKLKVVDSRKASNTLTKQLLQSGIPSTISFNNVVSTSVNDMQNSIDQIQFHVGQALVLSNNGFSATKIFQTNDLLNAQTGIIDGLKSQIVAALQAQNKSLAQQLLPQFNTAVNRQNSLANQEITRLNQAKDVIRPYQVCVRTVNSLGVPVPASDLFGFYCLNNATNQSIEPSNQEGTCFTLPSGTYTFDSYNGYFSGTSSNTVTLSRNLEVNGVITVDLVYWSE